MHNMTLWGQIVSSLGGNLHAIDAIAGQFHGSQIYPAVSAFTHAVNCLSRKEFLQNLQHFFHDSLHLHTEIICSVGAGIEGTRQAMIRGASCETCEPDERLIINIFGACTAGNLIPLVVLSDEGVELEGMINIAPSPGVQPDAARLAMIHGSAQIVALAFRNLKLSARLMEICPARMRGRLDAVLRGFNGDRSALARRLQQIGKYAEDRKMAHSTVHRGVARRLLRFFMTRVGIALVVLAFCAGSGLASYARVKPLSEPFNAAVAGLGKLIAGIPYDAGKRALDDGLLHVMVKSRSAQETHDWLKGNNPSGIDYEKVLRDNGWQDPYLHRVGRMLGMVP
jgi:hypothetical protein